MKKKKFRNLHIFEMMNNLRAKRRDKDFKKSNTNNDFFINLLNIVNSVRNKTQNNC